MKIEVKYIAPYLPYGLIFKWDSELYPMPVLTGINKNQLYFNYHGVGLSCTMGDNKPILHPLSDLIKEIEIKGERFVPIEIFVQVNKSIMYFEYNFLRDIVSKNTTYAITQCSYNLLQILFEWHFDVFGLIDQGLAININTL